MRRLAFSPPLPQKSRAFLEHASLAMTDFAAARRHMVDGQVRTADVTDLRLLSAMQELPRERFLPASVAGLAYLDLDVPVGAGRRLLKPMVLGKLIQALDLTGAEHVLDIGCAGGYGAAVLAHLAGDVVALEEDAALAKAATAALAGQANVSVVSGPLAAGWAPGGAYDAILIEGATELPPHALCRQLKEGGRLACVLGAGPGARAMLYCRTDGDIGGRAIFDAAAAVLPGFVKPAEFAF